MLYLDLAHEWHGFTGLPDEPFYNPIGLVATADQDGYLFVMGRIDDVINVAGT